MGLVYRAHDPEIDRDVAIKLVRADLLEGLSRDDFIARFRREAQAAARCAHPNIVAVYDYALHADSPFIAMELVNGESLSRALAAGRRLTPEEAVAIADQLLAALAAAHAVGIVHRDIKPANVLLDHDGHVKVTDFGIARLDRSDLTQSGMMVGTLSYMAPEQCRGEPVDGRTDLFATGALLHEMLTGLRAFPGHSETEVMQRLLFQPAAGLAPRDPRIPFAIGKVLSRALEKRPNDRYGSAREMAAALQAAKQEAADPGTVVMATPFAVPPPPPSPPIAPSPAAAPPAGASVPTTAQVGLPGTSPSATGYGIIPAADAAAVQRELAFFLGPIASVLVRRTAPRVGSTHELWEALAAHIERAEDRAAFLRKRPR